MTNIITFPQKEKREKPLPRQRVFYIGFRYVGPFLCQDVQSLYLKRKRVIEGVRWWSIIRYGHYDENDSREYSIELEECRENDLPDMLDEYDIGGEVTFDELKEMGWRGLVGHSATIIELSKKNNLLLSNQYLPNLSEE
jgi:hypothetical protein